MSGYRLPPFELCYPWDEHNRRLVEQVRPAGWVNPVPRGRYDLVVVGGGTGGLVTAAIASALGAKVALVERKLLGGDCLNVGCVPSKAVIRAARAWQSAKDARTSFGGPEVTNSGDFPAVMERMRALRADLSAHDGARRFTGLGVDVFLGHGRFTGPEQLEVDGERLAFRKAVIATGSRPAEDGIDGLAGVPYLTNESVFSLTSLPRRLAVVGAGPVGAELAQAFASFGSKVTLIERERRILPREDPDAAAAVSARMIANGVEILSGVSVERVSMEGATKLVEYPGVQGVDRLETDEILLALHRVPNADGLGLEDAGVHRTAAGFVQVDDRLRTSNPNVFAIGDVVSELQFTHVADAHARLVVRNALFAGRASVRELVIPWCTYTSPEVAHVGLPWPLIAGDGRVRTITVPFAEVDRARLDGCEDGFLKMHLESTGDRIVAATIVGEAAGELISQITQAMTAGIGLSRLGETIFPYPTQAEAIRKAADRFRREKLTPLARRLFGAYFRLRR